MTLSKQNSENQSSPNHDPSLPGKKPDAFRHREDVTDRLETVLVEVTEGCNLSCDHCDKHEQISSSSKFQSLTLEDVEQIASWEPENVVLLGGEPTTHPDIGRFIETFQDHGAEVSIQTNGSNRSRNAFKALKADSILVSIDGMRETNDQIRKTGSFQRATRLIYGIKTAGTDLSKLHPFNKLPMVPPYLDPDKTAKPWVDEGMAELGVTDPPDVGIRATYSRSNLREVKRLIHWFSDIVDMIFLFPLIPRNGGRDERVLKKINRKGAATVQDILQEMPRNDWGEEEIKNSVESLVDKGLVSPSKAGNSFIVTGKGKRYIERDGFETLNKDETAGLYTYATKAENVEVMVPSYKHFIDGGNCEEYMARCPAGRSRVTVNADGSVTNCFWQDITLGTIDDGIEKILSTGRRLSNSRPSKPSCVGCDHLDICQGGCPATTQSVRCPMSEKGKGSMDAFAVGGASTEWRFLVKQSQSLVKNRPMRGC